MIEFIIGLGLFVIVCLIDGFSFQVMWTWFAMPIFGAPYLSLPNAIGLSALIGLMQFPRTHPKDEDKIDAVKRFGYENFVRPLIYLVIGFVAFQFAK